MRPIASYKGTLALGDSLHDDTALNIDVERYPRTFLARPISAHNFVSKVKPVGLVEGDAAVGPSSSKPPAKKALQTQGSGEDDEAGMTAVKIERAYMVPDGDKAGGKKEVNREELDKGYMYGKSVVPISKTDEECVVMETSPAFEILGFVPKAGVSPLPPTPPLLSLRM